MEKGKKILFMCKQQGLPDWKRKYLWLTYVQPHFRYGALIFQENKEEMQKVNSKFNTFR